MKKLLAIFVIFNFCLQAQDSIRFRNGEVKAVKVSEVGVSEIKYNRFDNVGGPVYVAPKNEVLLIKYAGGSVDSFKVEKVAEVEVKKPRVTLEQSIAQNGPGKIVTQGTRLYFNNKAVGESRLLKMIMAHPDNNKQNRMLKSFKEMKSYKKKQYLIGFIGLGIGVGAPYIGFVATVFSENGIPLVAGIAIGGIVGITTGIISSINKHKRLQKKLEVARIYNGDL